MVKHIILWTLNPELTSEKKEQVKREIKAGLESLQGKIDGLVSIKVNIADRLASTRRVGLLVPL